MKIVLVGAGNLACSLGRALFEAGNDILQVYSRTCQAASALADALDASPVTEIDRISADADVYIVAVKDSVMADIVPSLCHGKEGKVFLHTSGSVAASVFEGRALHYGVLYPMQTFSKSKPLAFKDIPCFIEGNDELVLETVSKLAHSLSDSVFRLDSEARKHLHLAAVFACNFANHCYEISSEILAKYGIPFEVMLPLIDETIRNAINEVRAVKISGNGQAEINDGIQRLYKYYTARLQPIIDEFQRARENEQRKLDNITNYTIESELCREFERKRPDKSL